MSTTLAISTSDVQPLVFVPVRLGRQGPFDFALDTGAVMTIVTDDVARTAGIRGTEVKEGLGAAGRRMAVPLGRVASLAVGDAQLDDVQVGILRELPRCVGHGVLGYNVLRHFVVVVDYERQQLTLAPPSAHPTDPGRVPRASVPFTLAHPDRPLLLVDCVVNDTPARPFVLDTGASLTVVAPEVARTAGVAGGEPEPIVGAGGATSSAVTTLGSLAVGGAALRHVAAVIADIFGPLSEAAGTTIDGILGSNVLSRFRLEIDYPGGVVRLD